MIGLAACATCLLMLLAGFVRGAELSVGPGKAFSRIEQALAEAQPGDTILVFPLPDGKPYEKPAIYVAKPRITLRAADNDGKPVRLCGDGFSYSGQGNTPRAIVQFNRGADGCVLAGFELYGAHNASHNGAGVRINQANDIAIRDCIIHDNDMGIMSNGDGTPATAARQLIERCLIHSNGNTQDPGHNHNLYLGGTSVRLVGCQVHSSLTGHNVKSRAHQTIVLASYIHDSANREFDLVDARGDTTVAESHAAIVGCVIVKSPNCTGNRGVIHFGQDGGNEHDGTLFLAHNTIVTPFASPVVVLSSPRARAQLLNNIIWNAGATHGAQQLLDVQNPADRQTAVAGQCNWLSSSFASPALQTLSLERTFLAARGADPPFADPTGRDYRLVRPVAPFADSGQALPAELLKLIGGAVLEYRPPVGWIERANSTKPDLGAFEARDL